MDERSLFERWYSAHFSANTGKNISMAELKSMRGNNADMESPSSYYLRPANTRADYLTALWEGWKARSQE